MRRPRTITKWITMQKSEALVDGTPNYEAILERFDRCLSRLTFDGYDMYNLSNLHINVYDEVYDDGGVLQDDLVEVSATVDVIPEKPWVPAGAYAPYHGPVGLKPKRLHDLGRLNDLNEAIKMAEPSGSPHIQEWLDEREDLMKSLGINRKDLAHD